MSVPPDQVDFFLENEQRGRFRQRVIFSQDLALQLANGFIPRIFGKLWPGLKVLNDLCPLGRELVGIQALAPQIQAELGLG